jgi:hypothetical protein
VSDPTTVNPVATWVNRALKGTLDLGFDLAKGALISEAPWLKIWGISFVFNFTADYLKDKLYVLMATRTTFIVIDFQTFQERDAYLKSVQNLWAAQEQGDPDAEAKAKEDLRKKLGDLIRWNGSAPP